MKKIINIVILAMILTLSSLNTSEAKEWKNVTTDESVSKIADLLFEKN